MNKKQYQYPEHLFIRKDALVDHFKKQAETIRWNINSPEPNSFQTEEWQNTLDCAERMIAYLDSIEDEYIPRF